MVSHLKDLKVRCLKALDILEVLSHTTWGADRKLMLHLHHALILSKLSYGCEVYSSATPYRLKMLDSIHHSGVRLATGVFRSSIPSRLVDAGELPLDLYRQSLLVQYWYRLQRLPSSLACKTANRDIFHAFYDNHPRFPRPFSFRIKIILADMGIPNTGVSPCSFSTVPPWELPLVEHCKYFNGIKGNFTDSEMRLLFIEHMEVHRGSEFVFTDGSKSNAGVGFGVHFSDFNRGGALTCCGFKFHSRIAWYFNSYRKYCFSGR